MERMGHTSPAVALRYHTSWLTVYALIAARFDRLIAQVMKPKGTEGVDLFLIRAEHTFE
jgi:hypothetical protein